MLACMDARIDVYALLGLERGDAHIVRNAGGLVTDDTLRSLAASQGLLGTEEIVVIMHEGCGLHGADPDLGYGSFEDLDATLREGLEQLRSSPRLPRRERIRGLVYDPASGDLRAVE